MERIRDAQNDVPVALGSIQNAGPITEAAIGRSEFTYALFGEIKRHNSGNDVRNFLPVSTDILHRSSAHAAGNATETFDSGAVSLYTVGDELVPVFAGAGGKQNLFPVSLLFDSGDCN